MAITINIYDETYNKTKSISVDFIMEIIANDDPVNTLLTSAFKFTTSAKDLNNIGYTPRIVEGLAAPENLVLNGTHRSITGTTTAYANIDEMIEDYVHDYVNGHTANLYGSGVLAKPAMKFTT